MGATSDKDGPGARRFSGRVALVTGAGSGIGKAVAARLAAEGARVVIGDIHRERGAAAARALADAGAPVSFVEHDAGEETSWRDAISSTVETYGRLDVLVNNAYSGRATSVESLQIAALRDGFRVNLDGAAIGIRDCAAAMKDTGGAIVNVASVAALHGDPNNVAYSAAKAALLSLTKSAALQFAARTPAIRVNAVAPGSVRTYALESTMRALTGSAKDADVTALLGAVAQRIPMRRIADPAEIAACIAFLASDDASYITGQCLVADGGLTAGA